MSAQKRENTVAQLPKSTIRLLASSQVITSVTSVVKELMENSLDAGAVSIDIRLEKHGLEKIEVKDDGCGIREADCTCMALPHFTSKLKSFSDLDELDSYGFRGEALHSVCSVASVSITTKTSDDVTARRYRLDKCGQAVGFESVHGLKGTTVSVTDLFKNLPVRRQVMSCSKRMNDELKKVENIVKSLSVINPGVRVSLAHNKCLIWQKTAVKDLRLSVMQVFSYNLSKHLHHIVHHTDKVLLRDRILLCMVFVQSVQHLLKFLFIPQVLSEVLSRSFCDDVSPNKSVMCIVALNLPPDRLDINLEPNKTKIFIKDKEEILSCLSEQLDSYYSQKNTSTKVEKEVVEPKPKKKRMEEPKESIELEKVVLVNDTPEMRNNTPVSNQELRSSAIINTHNNNTPLQPISNQNIVTQENSVPFKNKTIDNSMKESRSQEIRTAQNLLQEIEYKPSTEDTTSLHDEPDTSFFEKTSTPHSQSTDNKLILSEGAANRQTNNSIPHVNLKNSSFSNERIDQSIFPPKTFGEPIIEPVLQRNEENGGSSELISAQYLNDFLDMEENLFQMINDEQHTVTAPDNLSLSQWSKGGLISASGDKIMGSCVLKQTSTEPSKQLPETFLQANTDSHLENTENSVPAVNCVLENDSKLLQEPVLTKCNPLPFENEHKTPVRARKVERLIVDEAANSPASSSDDNKSVALERSVSSQMGNKKMSGFTAFARQMRSEILKETPGISFTAVAGILASKWRSLQDNEKEKYYCIASSNKKKKLKTVETVVKKESVKSFCETHELERNFIVSDASMELLASASLNVISENSYCRVVGRIESSDVWICSRICQQGSPELGAINSKLLDEAHRFKQNMDMMEISVEPLERSIVISPRFLTEKLWDVLLSLESVPDASGEGISITDKRIVMNGFRIKISKQENVCAHLTGLARHLIDAYGADDVKMTLELIEKHGVDDCSLAQSRCPIARKYIRSETSRQCAQMMNRDKLNDAHELENRLRMLEYDKSTCWQSFYKTLHVLQ
ncbi:PMS1 protein homolog 1 [Nilaparvata lugens]|uniref:PMS1 protein homolog 1 n=1 Tax=Nilaparvata lugens TaxID=108931 RepID=UPI00193DCEB0|nr:PMS1 protein homolog 1 [Nilaparvata lugens]